MQLRTRNQADTQEDFENIIVKQTSEGATIRVKDVASVIDGFEQVNLLATVNGLRTILVQIQSGPTMDVVKASESVKAYLEKVQDDLPAGVSITTWEDAAETYNGRIKTIATNFFTGLILVCLTLMLFLRPIIAFWVSIGMISTFAFLLVIGVIVDDAIIVGEAIHFKTEEGETGLDAAVNGTSMVMKPVIFAVLTTMIFFAPWMYLSGGTSEFTRAISLVVIFALLFSLIESLLILPAHLAHLKPVNPKSKIMKFQNKISESLMWVAQNVYRPVPGI